MTAPRIGSLFSGYGGLDLAVEALTGATTAWVSDIDKGACKILTHRAPNVPNLGDITNIDWATVEPVDIITGGFPCQDLSHAGKRAGMTTTRTIPAGQQACGCQWADHTETCQAASPKGDVPARLKGAARERAIRALNNDDRKHPDRNRPERVVRTATRSGLWSHMARAIDELRPRLVVAENVRGLLSADAPGDVEPCSWCVGETPTVNLRALGVVLADLADLGYDAQWCGLRAADVGACHGRFRVFLIAHPAGDRWDQGWAEPARVLGRPDAAQRSHTAVDLLPTPEAKLGSSGPDYARAGRPGAGGDSLHEAVGRRLLPTPMADDARRDPAGVSAAARMAQGHQPSLGGIVNDLTLLPTPNPFHAGNEEDPEEWRERRADVFARTGTRHGPALGVIAKSIEAGDPLTPDRYMPDHMLPTPTARDWKNAGDPERTEARMADRGQPLTEIAVNLLPTPTVSDHPDARRSTVDGQSYSADGYTRNVLGDVAAQERFGDYAPAIARWELVIGRPAPDPTEPTGKGGAHRLSPKFVEWMMGLPEGWVTDVPDLTRNEALKALGNGVVPQQAVAALRHMLTTAEHPHPKVEASA